MLSRKFIPITCSRPRQLFQSKPPPRYSITIRDVEYMLVNTAKMPIDQKRDVFYASGMDYDRVFKYYRFVKTLEDSWIETPKKIEENKDPFVIKAVKFLIALVLTSW